MFLGRLPNRVNLYKRDIFVRGHELSCVWCSKGRESDEYLFARCHFPGSIWSEISKWLDVVLVLPENHCILLQSFCFFSNNGKRSNGLLLFGIQFCVNFMPGTEIIFGSKVPKMEEVVETIKHLSEKNWGTILLFFFFI